MRKKQLNRILIALAVLASGVCVLAQTDLLVYKGGKIIFAGSTAEVNDISVTGGKLTITDNSRATVFNAEGVDSLQLPLLYEDFQWVPSTGGSVVGWDTSGESNNRIDKQKATYDEHGWESRSANGVYGRPGFVKLGRTSFGGDLLSPALSELGNQEATVRVEFQAVGYANADGGRDVGNLYVGVVGDGAVTAVECKGTSEIVDGVAYLNEAGAAIKLDRVAHITLPADGYFLKDASVDDVENCTATWDKDVTRYAVTITGVKKNSRLAFIGGALGSALGSQVKNRIFIDNIKVLTVASQKGLATISGKVQCAGTGIEGVAVSDGVDVTTTDANGEYTLFSDKTNGFVFISIPGGYDMATNGTGNQPAFFKRLSNAASEDETADFELVRNDNDNFVMLTLADMHLANRNNDKSQFESGFIKDANTLIAKYKEEGKDVYGLTLGDQSWDLYWYSNKFNLYNAAKEIENLNCPVFHIMGNHDNDPYVAADFGAEEAFRNFIGPVYYSFNIGKVHYIVLDNIQYTNAGGSYGTIGDRGYSRKVSNVQMEWLRRDLATIADKSTPIAVAMHAPLHFVLRSPVLGSVASNFGVDNGAALEKAFDGYTNVTFLSGHTHVNCTMASSTSSNIKEYNTAAVCATWWWTGKSGYAGNHICTDGTPGGYGVWNHNGTDCTYKYKGIGYAEDYQFRVYDLNQVVVDSRWISGANSTYSAMLPIYVGDYGTASTDNEVLVNCWGWGPGWKISISEGETPLEVAQVSTQDPLHIISYECQRLKHNATPSSGFISDKYAHFFKAKASSATSTINVTVTDSWGRSYSQTITRPKSFGYLMR